MRVIDFSSELKLKIMMLTRNKILIICLSLLVAFAPVPALAANYASNHQVPCSMDMQSMQMNAHDSQHHTQQQNTGSAKHCDNCKQDGHACQKCDCSVLGCFVSKVQYYFEAAIPPRLAASSSKLFLSKSHPPHSRLTPPLLRPPIKLYS